MSSVTTVSAILRIIQILISLRLRARKVVEYDGSIDTHLWLTRKIICGGGEIISERQWKAGKFQPCMLGARPHLMEIPRAPTPLTFSLGSHETSNITSDPCAPIETGCAEAMEEYLGLPLM